MLKFDPSLDKTYNCDFVHCMDSLKVNFRNKIILQIFKVNSPVSYKMQRDTS